MRKPRRLSTEELAPHIWELPALRWPRTGPSDPAEQATTDSVPSVTTAAPAWIDWAALFGNSQPVEVEVGMGKGLFLLTQALARPDVNFFGIEIVRKHQLYAATRCAIRGLSNVRTSCGDATRLVRDFIAPGSVSAIHVLFPDPWWKKRHRKRRVFTPEFAASIARAITLGGHLHIASDVGEYFEVMSGIVRAMPAFRELSAETSRESIDVAGYQTNFERKARLKGTPVWRARYQRTAEAVTVAPDPAANDLTTAPS